MRIFRKYCHRGIFEESNRTETKLVAGATFVLTVFATRKNNTMRKKNLPV